MIKKMTLISIVPPPCAGPIEFQKIIIFQFFTEFIGLVCGVGNNAIASGLRTPPLISMEAKGAVARIARLGVMI